MDAGHLKLRIADGPDIFDIDVAALESKADLLKRLGKQSSPGVEVKLPSFPGGTAVLASVLRHLLAAAPADESLHDTSELSDTSRLSDPALSSESLLSYIHAGLVLESARLLADLAASSVCRALLPRQAAALLEQALTLTEAEACDIAPRDGPASDSVLAAVGAVIARLCSQLEPRDFRLGPQLACGSAEACLQILISHRKHAIADVEGAPQAEEANADGLGDWSERRYAVHVVRKHLHSATKAALRSGRARKPPTLPERDKVGAEDCTPFEGGGGPLSKEDVDEALADAAPDVVLKPLAGFADFLNLAKTPPLLAAVLVRALLVAEDEDAVQTTLQVIFARNLKVRLMLASGDIPVDYLKAVAVHPEASQTLRWMLARYSSTDPEEFCDLVEDVLTPLLDEPHSYDLIIKHALMHDLILWTRGGGRPDGAERGALSFKEETDAEVAAVQGRLRSVGLHLFQLSFLAHNGFLSKEEKTATGAANGSALKDAACAWDIGSLDLPMLASLPRVEDTMQLARRVLLRQLRRKVGEEGLLEVSKVWPLGRWTLCRDVAMMKEAFTFLSGCWKALASLPGLGDMRLPGGGVQDSSVGGFRLGDGCSRRDAEELLLTMFTHLEIWRLPQEDLCTPWVPGQVLAAHVAAQCQQLEQQQLSLIEETRQNLEEISRLNATISKLTSRLEATDARSLQCMQKQADINDTLKQLR
eukprot:TRINITY_DN74163_c0_g1_i1.p1 TRINITY_DN74163_c0_g1~~TRINITY_DN74163_c0_g1_i1.p1  ORF type:complete len:704 (-),score=160.20 TRINITY_DN74163_c0_g1_i1:69-2180(-)